MQSNIFCHICDEELADTIENLPDKCPICDTRKYEIVQELQSMEDEKTGPDWQEVTESVSLSVAPTKSTPTIVEEQDTRDIVKDDNLQDGVIFREHIPMDEESSFDISTENDSEQESYFDISTENDSEEESSSSDSDVFESQSSSGTDVSEIKEDVIFDDDDSKETKETPKETKKTFSKTGASALEFLPQSGSGFPKGNYLIMYSVERKAIAYFRLDGAGSIIIGRSSERGSPNDIDVTMAWKQYHQNNGGSESELQDKMRMVKGISRKHALIRYDKDKKSYVLFHLSDKNYTIVSFSGEDKRERAPGNRNPVYLKHNSLISMGNNKNYIIMRFKTI